VIVALAGRRIDAPDARPERFPAKNRAEVGAAIADELRALGATAVVASAACGADLLAHEAALALGIRSRVVLPFDRERFRATSVVDRPGNWEELYERVCDAAYAVGDLVVLPDAGDPDAAYAAATRAILDEAAALARVAPAPAGPVALVVWDGARRGENDFTAEFALDASARGWRVKPIPTR